MNGSFRARVRSRRGAEIGMACTIDAIVERVALDRHACPASANKALEIGAREVFGRGCARIVINLLFSMTVPSEIVGAETQGDLCDARREHDPIGLDVIEIVEYQARGGDVVFQVVETSRAGQIIKRRIRPGETRAE